MSSHHLRTLAEQILQEDAIDPYQIHQRFRLSPSQIIDAMATLNKVGVAELTGGRIRRKAGWKKAIMNHRHLLFRDLEFKAVPSSFFEERAAESIYVPNYDLIKIRSLSPATSDSKKIRQSEG